MKLPVFRINCPDEKGLVHRVTGVLFGRGLNIVTNHEFVDARRGRFFMRTTFTGDYDAESLRAALLNVLPEGSTALLVAPGKKKLVVFASRESHCLGDLLLRHAHGELPIDLLAVVSNHDKLQRLTERFEIPFHHVAHEGHSREAHEALLHPIVAAYRPDVLVLAKYMRVLTPEFVARYASRLVNIHHSFLPAFVGANPYRQAFDRGVKIIGATAHFVTDNLDEGPIIAQSVLPVDHSHSASDMAQAGRDVEKVVLARALRLVCEERVFVAGNRTVIFD